MHGNAKKRELFYSISNLFYVKNQLASLINQVNSVMDLKILSAKLHCRPARQHTRTASMLLSPRSQIGM